MSLDIVSLGFGSTASPLARNPDDPEGLVASLAGRNPFAAVIHSVDNSYPQLTHRFSEELYTELALRVAAYRLPRGLTSTGGEATGLG